MLLFSMIVNNDSIRYQSSTEHSFDLDESLILRIANRDMSAFDELYYKTERILYSYILSIVRHHDDSLDILQEVYVKLNNSAHLYQPQGKPMAWLFTISKNLSYDFLKSKKQTLDLDVIDLENSAEYSYVVDEKDKELLNIALNILTTQERSIVLLSAISGFKHREIAEHLDLKLNTVISKYSRAIKKMRDYMREEGLM